jgi:ElaB/YqjD/DUF883 family membrane-anchored ribosome-binding protein
MTGNDLELSILSLKQKLMGHEFDTWYLHITPRNTYLTSEQEAQQLKSKIEARLQAIDRVDSLMAELGIEDLEYCLVDTMNKKKLNEYDTLRQKIEKEVFELESEIRVWQERIDLDSRDYTEQAKKHIEKRRAEYALTRMKSLLEPKK